MFFDQLQEILPIILFRIPYPTLADGSLIWNTGDQGFAIYTYGVLIAIGIGLGAFISGREIERRGYSSDDFYNGLLIAVISGYIFARLGYVVQDNLANGTQYNGVLEVFNFRAGGVNIMWGFVGAFLLTFWWARRQNLSVWDYADVAGLTILLAQGIGRWGNFVNQELYGPPTGSETWGLLINNPIAEYASLPVGTRFHPTFFYESIALLLGFVILMVYFRRYRDNLIPGLGFGFFMLWWGGNRAWIELFRPDQPNIGNSPLTWSMLVAIGVALAGLYVILLVTGRIPGRDASISSAQSRKRRVYKPARKRD
ncbi:MAG: prolipoprotein diacylglyceryl transferase [Chloroflexota bacterium]